LGFDILSEIPDYKERFHHLQSMSKHGHTQRKDMPVIDSSDVKELQARLKSGSIDVHTPFLHTGDPFPSGLSKKDADDWVTNGLRDGEMKDDVVNVGMKKVSAGKLFPIQQQIYMTKVLDVIAKFGVQKSEAFVFGGPAIFVCSSNHYIIDGHHRWAQALILNPKKSVNCLVIDLPINKLLPMTLTYGDAIGNKRNA
jgi:hypothetical protein